MKLYRFANSVTVPLSIFLAILATVHGDGDPHSSVYCTNKECRTAVRELFRHQKRSINPCDDFYDHACSKGRGGDDPVTYINFKILDEMTELFKNVQPGDMEALTKAKQFQDVCADEDTIERRGLRPFAMILSDNGEWPLIVPSDTWNIPNFSWQEIHENLVKRTGISALFDITAGIDRSNPRVHILSLSVPTVPSERVYFVARVKRETRSSDYQKYLVGVIKEMNILRGFDIKDDDLLADIEGIVKLEDELAKLAINLDTDYNENGDDLRVTTIETLQKDWDAIVPRISDYKINWLNVIKDRFNGTDIVIEASEKIALKPAAFICNFVRVLINTPVRTIVNYIHWKVIDNLVDAAHSEYWNPHLQPRAMSESRSGSCIANHKMVHAVSYIYVKRYFDVRSKTAALEMVENIRDEIKRAIGDSSWLDEATKSVTTEKKLDAMTNFVGYPEWYDEPGKIDEYYRGFTVGPNHFENVLAYNKFAAIKQMSKLRSPVDETETDWIAFPYISNAEYLQQPNALSIPASIIQSPIFAHERPTVLNYGSLGAIIGHEVAHALDNHGRLYDGAGVKRKWWPQTAIDAYKTKAQCFVEQYNKYTVDLEKVNETFDYEKGTFNVTGRTIEVVHINGTESQAENIADTMGLRATLRAYQRLRNDGKTNGVKIERLGNFTDEQLYFYQLTYTFCSPWPIDSVETGHMNTHCPESVRIRGALSNMQEFADAFNCPLGSPMNPPKKCHIWD